MEKSSIETEQDNCYRLVAEVDHAIHLGELDEAKRLVAQCITANPTFGPAYNHLAWIQVTEGDFSSAELNYRKAIALSPEFHSTYINLAIFLNAQGKFDEVLELYATAIDVPGVRKDILNYECGIANELLGNYTIAIEAYKTAMRFSLITQDVEQSQEAVKRCEMKLGTLC